MHLHKALKADPARLAAFRAICQPDVLSGDALVRLKAHPSFAGVTLPYSLAELRKLYDCEGQRGGRRPVSRPLRYVHRARERQGKEARV